MESKAIEGGGYDDSDLRNRVTNLESIDTSKFVTDEKLESKGYLKSHQDITGLATKEELANLVTNDQLEAKHYITGTALENYALKSDIPQGYNDTEVKERLTVLENKQDNDTVYNDTELRNRVEVLENKPNVDLTNYVTTEQLENKHYLTQHQPLDNLVTKEELNSKGYVTEEVLNGKNYLTEDVLNTKNYLTQHQDLSSLVTKQELENKHYLTEHQNISHLVTKDELETKGYLTQHQSLEEYAKKSELYNDTEVKQRLTTLESKPNIDTSNFVTNRDLESKGYINDFSNFVTKDEGSELRNSVTNLKKRLDSAVSDYVNRQELLVYGYVTKDELEGFVRENIKQILSENN